MDYELTEEDINRTEMASIYISWGFRPTRVTARDAIESSFNECTSEKSAQQLLRERTESFVKKNWQYLKHIAEVYGCTGDCASTKNKCSDVRASHCHSECFPKRRK